MQSHALADLLAAQVAAGRPYHEFLRSGAMSVGLYVLEAGAVDRQSPHGQDEIYVVMSGRARFTAGDEMRGAVSGDVIYVPARVPHRFHDITERLELMVVFAPPES